MSAVIWFGIVAVWAFVLIPTWVRRSDLHWRRSDDASTTRSPLGRAARVISRSGSATRRTTTVPRARRAPAAASSRRPVAAAVAVTASTATVTATVAAAPAASATVAASEPPSTTSEPASTATETAPSAQGPTAAEPEAPMTTPRAPRPVHRRTTAGARRKPTPPPHVQRARRLVWIAATALATLLLALILGGMWLLVHLACDVALVAYLRHLRGIAVRQQEARRARRAPAPHTETARESRREAPAARTSAPAPRASRRIAEVRARVEEKRVTVPAGAPDEPELTDEASVAASPAVSASAPTARSRMRPAPQVIDLTEGSLADDCPTTELMAARAV